MCLCQSVTQILSDVFLNVICLILLFSFLHIKCRAEKGNLGVPLLPGQGCSFYSFKTNTYKLNFMESPSGIKVNVAYFSFPTAFLTNLVRLIKVEGSFHLSKDSCVFWARWRDLNFWIGWLQWLAVVLALLYQTLQFSLATFMLTIFVYLSSIMLLFFSLERAGELRVVVLIGRKNGPIHNVTFRKAVDIFSH